MAQYKFDWLAALIPGYGHYRATKNLINNLKTNGVSWKDFNGGFWREEEDPAYNIEDTSDFLTETVNNARTEYLEDREHTEMREDTAYQRAVADMRAAGLNPYTIGSTPASSSASSVGENTLMTKLQAVGYVLDMKNIDINNKRLANGILGTILGYVAGSKLGARK